MRITTGSPPPRDGQIPILSTSIQPSPAAHADLPHQSAGSDSFRKDFLPLLILLLLKTPENEGMLKTPGSPSLNTPTSEPKLQSGQFERQIKLLSERKDA